MKSKPAAKPLLVSSTTTTEISRWWWGHQASGRHTVRWWWGNQASGKKKGAQIALCPIS